MSNTNSTDHRFKVGDFVKVIDPDHPQHGCVGKVTSVSSRLVNINLGAYFHTSVRPSSLDLLHISTDLLHISTKSFSSEETDPGFKATAKVDVQPSDHSDHTLWYAMGDQETMTVWLRGTYDGDHTCVFSSHADWRVGDIIDLECSSLSLFPYFGSVTLTQKR